jgi:hypothetical protein
MAYFNKRKPVIENLFANIRLIIVFFVSFVVQKKLKV